MTSPTLLVVAKAPVAGLAKTRIGAHTGYQVAASLAAAALLDTLRTAEAVGWPVVVAMTGDLESAVRGDEIGQALAGLRVVPQQGADLGERLAQAHVDADAGHGVVQIGMDTPHATADQILAAATPVAAGRPVIGPAEDGGWWLLGVPHGHDAQVLADVPMSQDDTGARTAEAVGVADVVDTLRDMDTWEDAVAIAALAPESELARVVAEQSDHLLESEPA